MASDDRLDRCCVVSAPARHARTPRCQGCGAPRWVSLLPTVPTIRTRRARTMDALRLLKEDHVKVKKMLSELDATTERAVKTRGSVFSQLKDELEIHEAIEEEFLYPALKNHPETRDIALEAFEEHHVVDEVMGEMLDLPVSDETWTAKFAVMKEN